MSVESALAWRDLAVTKLDEARGKIDPKDWGEDGQLKGLMKDLNEATDALGEAEWWRDHPGCS